MTLETLTKAHPLISAMLILATTLTVLIVVNRVIYRLTPKPASGAFYTSRKRARKSLYYTFASSILSILILAIGTYVLADMWGLDAKLITAIAGLGTVIMSLSTREVASDFISGTQIILRDIFRPGDIISTTSVTGRVKRLGLRSTVVKNTTTGAVVFLSNTSLMSYVENLTKEAPRLSIRISIGTDKTPDKETYYKLRRQVNECLNRIKDQLALSSITQARGNIVDTGEIPKIKEVAEFIDPEISLHGKEFSGLQVTKALKRSPYTIPSIVSFAFQGISDVSESSVTLDYLVEFTNPQARSQLLRMILTELFLRLSAPVSIEEITDGTRTH